MSPDEILGLRQSKAVPVLTEIKEWMLLEISKVLPRSPIGQAIAYSLERWDKLSIYTSDSKLKINNNPVEREHAQRCQPGAGEACPEQHDGGTTGR